MGTMAVIEWLTPCWEVLRLATLPCRLNHARFRPAELLDAFPQQVANRWTVGLPVTTGLTLLAFCATFAPIAGIAAVPAFSTFSTFSTLAVLAGSAIRPRFALQSLFTLLAFATVHPRLARLAGLANGPIRPIVSDLASETLFAIMPIGPGCARLTLLARLPTLAIGSSHS